MRSKLIVLAFLLFAGLGSNSQAGQVTFEGDVGFWTSASSSGVINLVIDLETIDSLQNGGLSFGIEHDNPQLLTFTGATVNNPSGRWTVASAEPLTATSVGFNIFSVQSPAFPTGGQDQLIATVNYQIAANAAGLARLTWITNEESLVDGRNFGTPVTADYIFVPNFISTAPEPATLAMAGLGVLGLALRRSKV